MKASRKTRFVRWIAAFVSIVLFGTYLGSLSMNPLTVSAICCRKDGFDKSRYTLTGNVAQDVATIAKSQAGRTCSDFGYSGVDYGAWCDEYVADCLENAGCDDSIVAHGGTVADFEKKMRKRGAVVVSSPQPGDLLFFSWSHVEIVTRVEGGTVYCAGGNNQGKTYPGGRCAGERNAQSVAKSMGGSIRLYLRPNYKGVNPNPPTNLSISSDKTAYKVGESINFSFSYSNATDVYILIDANGVRVEPWANVTGKTSYSCTFNEPGYYVYRLYAVNEYGTPATEWKVFTVYDREPDNMYVQCDKNSYAVGETINFNFSVNNAETAYILIDANGVRVEPWANVTGKTSYSCSFDKPGYYVYRLYAVNEYGTPATEWKVFTVYDKEPDNMSIQCDKDCYAVGETINFDFSVNNAETAYVLIDANGVRVEPWANVTGETSYSCSFDEPGYYVYRLYAVNRYGTPATEWKAFTVYDEEPNNMSIQCDKDCYAIGETINFDFSVTNAENAYILIDANGVRVEPWANVTGKTSYSYTFDEPGRYVYRLYAVNKYGTPATEWKEFYVYMNYDVNADEKIDVADAVLLQRYLLGEDTLTQTQWQTADLNADGTVNGFDLALLRQKLA
ncbi:dockerin type I domain-containing protein [uncultured Ruminococcus sp.]|uniref:dockerin type I domain-containing protein n=1 Tax=uncultured Ruminococcus sp. TaxID=165186 RepID=UPI00266BE781|nr:dockerin type I domain-containing protein [uncultured Ruminococcus sp.]